MIGQHFLDSDNDGHWYVVEADKRAEWEVWLEIDSEDERAWTAPTFATELGSGPNTVVFGNYEHS